MNLLEIRRRMFCKMSGGGGELPSGYTQYDWVEANSTTGYPKIETGLTPDLSNEWVFEGKFAKAGAIAMNYYVIALFRKSGSSTVSDYGITRYGNTTNQICAVYNSRANFNVTNWVINLPTIKNGEWHSFKLGPTEGVTYGGQCDLDGTVYSASLGSVTSSDTQLVILPLETTTNSGFPCRFARFKISYQGVLVADMVPAKRDSDGVVGFYDVVRDLFLTPSIEGVTLLCGYGFEDFTV